MKRRLWQNALLISPVMAMYATGSSYSSHDLAAVSLISIFLATTLVCLLVWAVHIYFALNFPSLGNFWKFVLSYLVIILLRTLLVILVPVSSKELDFSLTRESVYNLFLSLVPNAVTLILCNSIVAEYKRIAAEKEVQELKFQNSEAQMQVLAQQLQPHFLFNALGVLKSLIASSPKKAEWYTIRLSHFLQYSILSHREDVVSLEKELNFVSDYIALQKVRFGDAFICDIQIPEIGLTEKLPVFALQVLVENIFKHNSFTEKKPLTFSILYQAGSVSVSNKKNLAKHVERSNTGLSNLNARYMLIINRPIQIDETEDVFSVTIPTIDK